jgi:hypothetical protein
MLLLLLPLLLILPQTQAAIDFEKQIVGLVPVPPGEPNVKLHYIMSQQRMSEDGRKTYTPYNADNKTFTYLPGNDTAYLKWALNDISYHHEVRVLLE